MIKNIYSIFSNFEMHNRIFLSRHKFVYALIGGAGAILYWRGVWHSADYLYEWGYQNRETFFGGLSEILFSSFGSMILGTLLLSSTGLLVSEFIGDSIIMSGLKKEKKTIDKSEEEIRKDELKDEREIKLIEEIDKHLHDIKTIKK